MVEIGNFLYFLAILILVVVTIFLNYLCNRFGRRFTYILCFTLLWMNFLLHFYKQLWPSYIADYPYSLRMSSLENLCAASIFVSPFVYKWGPKWLKNYLVIISIISGAVVFIAPTVALNRPLENITNLIEVNRFYACHLILIMVPILLVSTGIVKLDYKYSLTLPFLFAHMGIVLLNEVMLKGIGLIDCSWLDILSRDYRNAAAAMGLPSSMDASMGFLYYIMPHFYIDGVLYFVPCIWAIVPLVILVPWIGIIFSYPMQHREMKRDYLAFKMYLKVHKEERKLRYGQRH